MVRKKDQGYYFRVDRRDLIKVDGDIALLLWYSKLKDYSYRFKVDKTGFIRIPPSVLEEDMMFNKKKVQRYNNKLSDKGLIIIDRAHRGGRTWAGYKII